MPKCKFCGKTTNNYDWIAPGYVCSKCTRKVENDNIFTIDWSKAASSEATVSFV